MTTRDPRSRPVDHPAGRPEKASATGPVREITQSLQVSIDDPFSGPEEPSERTSHPSLALGTHEAQARANDDRTKVESPGARVRTPPPARPASSSGAKATRPPPLPAGEIDHVGSVLGSYKVLELLGKGGMGYVFRAEHVKLGREVALKLLRADYAKRRDAVLRFFQEAKTVNRVRHRNIVDVTDFVELPDGTTFIIMELLSGMSLGKWARTGVDLPRALAVLVQICDGLAAAHSVGVVHRDLKPDNIIVVPTSDGAELVKLLDFGVAKLLNRDDEDIGFQTAAGSVIGTPAYMSPEQAGGMTVDGRSDIYSLGAIMYELFCGQPMFRGRSFGEYVRKHLTEMPPAPRLTAAGAGIDPRLDELIMRCLQKEPSARFTSIVELRDALLGMLGMMETHSSIALLTGSAIRPMPSTIMPQLSPPDMGVALPMPSLPAPPSPSYAPALGSQPSGVVAPYPYAGYSQSAPYNGYQTHGSHIVPPTGIQGQATPWWVWFVGGAAAVGLGIGAAVWFAGSDEPAVAAAAETESAETSAEPIEPEAPVPTAPLEIKFDSLPSGGVYAEGKSAELCHTPCSFVIDPTDGGATDTRTFVVRAAGYRDSTVQVDLRGTRRDYQVTLVHAEPTVTTAPTVADPPAQPAARPSKRPAKSTKKSSKPASKPDAAPTVKKKPGGIDPTETLDPFQ